MMTERTAQEILAVFKEKCRLRETEASPMNIAFDNLHNALSKSRVDGISISNSLKDIGSKIEIINNNLDNRK